MKKFIYSIIYFCLLLLVFFFIKYLQNFNTSNIFNVFLYILFMLMTILFVFINIKYIENSSLYKCEYNNKEQVWELYKYGYFKKFLIEKGDYTTIINKYNYLTNKNNNE